MTKLLICLIASYIFGFITAIIICKFKKNENSLIKLLYEFKTTIDEYKNQSTVNNIEIKEALKDAVKLSKVLTTNQNLKGEYGENCLENIIKTCYPELNSDYFKQVNLKNSNDESIKPDYLVKLPDNKCVLIDSKTALDKFIEYKESIGSEFEKSAKNNFIADLNNTITNLSNKKYETALNCTQPDFILMYIPFEPIITTIYTDNDFKSVVKKASEKNIIIVGNSSVLTVIKLIRLLWAKDTQNQNMKNIINSAENIYNLIVTHSQNLEKVKISMENNYLNFKKEYEKMKEDSKIFKYVENLKNYGIQEKGKKSTTIQ